MFPQIPQQSGNNKRIRATLAGYAGYGYCASHHKYFWGMRLYLFSTPDGMPVIWGLASPKIAEREAIEQMLRGCRHLVFEGQVILRDKGFVGKDFEGFITGELGAHLVRPEKEGRETPVRAVRRDPAMDRVGL